MYCKKCGKELKEGSKFCTKCGTPISQTKEEAVTAAKIEESEATEVKETEIKEISGLASVEEPAEEDKSHSKDDVAITISKKTLRNIVVGVLIVALIVIGIIVILSRTKSLTTKGEHQELGRYIDGFVDAIENGNIKDYGFAYEAKDVIRVAYKQGKLGYIYYDYNGDGHDDLIIGNIEVMKDSSSGLEYTLVYLITETYQVSDGYNSVVKYRAFYEDWGDSRHGYCLLDGNRVCEKWGDEDSSVAVYDASGIIEGYGLFQDNKPIKLKLLPLTKR